MVAPAFLQFNDPLGSTMFSTGSRQLRASDQLFHMSFNIHWFGLSSFARNVTALQPKHLFGLFIVAWIRVKYHQLNSAHKQCGVALVNTEFVVCSCKKSSGHASPGICSSHVVSLAVTSSHQPSHKV